VYNVSMKKILIVVVIIAALFYLFKDSKSEVKTTVPDNPDATFRPDPTLATFSGLEGEVTILEEKAYGDINGDQKPDTAVLLAESGGGSGVFIYAAAYVSGPVNYKGTNAVFLGDRIAPQTVSINAAGVIKVSYLDRAPDEAFAAEPTISVSKELIYRNGSLSEK